MKRCSKCGQRKPVAAFHRNKRTKDGFTYRCQDCLNAYQRNYYERIERPKNQTAEGKALRATKDANWRARQAGQADRLTVQEWMDLCNKHGDVCLNCKQAKPLTIDHIQPLAIGGPNTIDNIQPLCINCNAKKHTDTMDFRPPESDA